VVAVEEEGRGALLVEEVAVDVGVAAADFCSASFGKGLAEMLGIFDSSIRVFLKVSKFPSRCASAS
jgi:hypothetical protein